MKRLTFVFLLIPAAIIATGLMGRAKSVAKRQWILKPGVNCKVADYQSVFGMKNVRSFGSSFDSSWTDKEGSTSVSATNGGSLSSSGNTYQFAPSHGWAGVVNNYAPDISSPMEVGLEAVYKVTAHSVEAYPTTKGEGGGYARAMLMLRVTDKEDNKVYTKWILNYGAIAGAFLSGETQDKDSNPLTGTCQ